MNIKRILRSRLLNNISWLLLDKLIRIIGGLLIGIWVARYLGPKEYGVLNYSIAYSTLFAIFVNLGLNQIVVRELVKHKSQKNKILGSVFVLKLLGGGIAIAFVAISLIVVHTDQMTKLVILILSIGFVFQSFDVIDYYYQSKILSKYVVIARNLAFIFSAGGKVLLILGEFQVLFFAMAYLLDLALIALFLALSYRLRESKLRRWQFSTSIALALLRDSWPMAITLMLVTIHLRVDQVMIGRILDLEQVGVYSVSVKLSEIWYFVPAILTSTLMPYFVNLKETDSGMYNFRLCQLYCIMFWMGMGIGVLTSIFGYDVVTLLYGTEFQGAFEALAINIWAGIFVAQSSAKGIWIITENVQIYRIVLNLIAISFNIGLNLALIPVLGIAGAGVATLLTRFINNWISPFLVPAYRQNTLTSIKSINPFFVMAQRPDPS